MEEIFKCEKEEKIQLFMPLMKGVHNNEYAAVLTHTAMDRDDEFISKSFMQQGAEQEYLPALMNHENDVRGLVAEWVDKRVEKDGDEYALVAVPKFYMSNPNAVMIKGMLDEGAKVGVSITAIAHEYEMIEKSGKKYKRYTAGEIVSADFVGIQAQKYAQALKVAKNFKIFKNDKEADNMNEEEKASLIKELSENLKPAIQDAVKKAVDEVKDELKKNSSEAAEAVEKNIREDFEKKLKESAEAVEKSKVQEREEMLKKLNDLVPKQDNDATTADSVEKGVAEEFISIRKGAR